MTAEDILQKFVPFSERILITGINGLLGQKLHQLLSPTNYIIGVNLKPDTHLQGRQFEYHRVDITKASEVIDLIIETQPRFIVNTAAMTGVDLCEKKKEQCWRVNVLAVEHLIKGAKKVDAHLIQLSTDYVFDGEHPPYKEDDQPNPLGYYGQTKLEAENKLRGSGARHSIVRTQVLYGVAPNIRDNFVVYIRNKLTEGKPFEIIDGQTGHATLADDLAEGIARIMQLQRNGIFHITGSEALTRYHLARKIAAEFGANTDLIIRQDPEDFEQPADRPKDSTFDLTKINKQLAFYPRNVSEGLKEYHRQLREYQTALGGKE